MDKQQAPFETRGVRFRGHGVCEHSNGGDMFDRLYRLMNIPRSVGDDHHNHDQTAGRWAWIGMFMAEIGFGLYWIIPSVCSVETHSFSSSQGQTF
ncbi:hypothetical protein TIFTF001_028195 [Ficus carica]|uniref:Uncharacterized protein n=1 Tax=Ficus carica TaxID=3494 RepID=A0AA88DPB4_FICCA|nr:hypothetical protein TIFTF001_028195 [Ficus carica]